MEVYNNEQSGVEYTQIFWSGLLPVGLWS